MAKSSPDGRSQPWLTHATSLIAASVCGSDVCSTDCHGGIENLAAFGDRSFALAAEFSDAIQTFAVARRHGVAQG